MMHVPGAEALSTSEKDVAHIVDQLWFDNGDWISSTIFFSLQLLLTCRQTVAERFGQFTQGAAADADAMMWCPFVPVMSQTYTSSTL
jgi:hypothetical protein